jgi:DnaJ-class molecular chaperone
MSENPTICGASIYKATCQQEKGHPGPHYAKAEGYEFTWHDVCPRCGGTGLHPVETVPATGLTRCCSLCGGARKSQATIRLISFDPESEGER